MTPAAAAAAAELSTLLLKRACNEKQYMQGYMSYGIQLVFLLLFASTFVYMRAQVVATTYDVKTAAPREIQHFFLTLPPKLESY